MFRLLHTADWHLGQKLDRFERLPEQEAFLDWLLEQLTDNPVDALLVCGDIFDNANPPVNALRLFIRFVVRARQVCPHVVLIAGNHDSAGRLDALEPALHELGIHLVGSFPQTIEQCLFRLGGDANQPGILLAALPYIRPVDLPPSPAGETVGEGVIRVTQAMISLYNNALTEIKHRQRSNEPIILTGHLFALGGIPSDESERPVQIEAGLIQAVPGSIFGTEPVYVALGHLHRCQQVKGHVPIWYSGSPLPLSFSEASYEHRVIRVTLPDNHAGPEIAFLEVPQSVTMIDQTGTFEQVCQQLDQLVDRYPNGSPGQLLLRVTVSLTEPRPDLRHEILDRVQGSNINLLAIRRSGDINAGLADALDQQLVLEQLTPIEVLKMKYRLDYEAEAPPELVQVYLDLLEEIRTAEDTTRSGECD
ncbi:exonuclease SbcCD subunit D C-terminal domain-containing protein [bacterium]|nr:exonuclease SbcCD subunit D C-terminal domain-containing protein [bacterium]